MKKRQLVETIKAHLEKQFSLPKDQIDTMMPSFISTLGMHMQNLENACAENNPVLLGKLGHTIKGAFLNLGLNECATIARSIEEKGKLGDGSTEFSKLVEDLRFRVSPILD